MLVRTEVTPATNREHIIEFVTGCGLLEGSLTFILVVLYHILHAQNIRRFPVINSTSSRELLI